MIVQIADLQRTVVDLTRDLDMTDPAVRATLRAAQRRNGLRLHELRRVSRSYRRTVAVAGGSAQLRGELLSDGDEHAVSSEALDVLDDGSGDRRIAVQHAALDVLDERAVRQVGTADEGDRPIDDQDLGVQRRPGGATIRGPGQPGRGHPRERVGRS